MDSKTLKAFVIEHKDKGLSYQDISDKLREEFNIIRSRQALRGIYTRAMNSNNNQKLVIDCHIFNLSALGYNSTEIHKLIKQLGHQVAYRYITNTVKDNRESIEEAIKSYSNRVINNRKILLSVDDIYGIIDYKGIRANEKGIDIIIKKAYKELITKASVDILKELYQITDNRKIIRDMLEDINLDIKVSDIEKGMI